MLMRRGKKTKFTKKENKFFVAPNLLLQRFRFSLSNFAVRCSFFFQHWHNNGSSKSKNNAMQKIILCVFTMLTFAAFSSAQSLHVGVKAGSNLTKIDGQSFKQ